MKKLKYVETLDKCEEIKENLNELENFLFFNMNQELANEFISQKNVLINWIEEIEFTINDYIQN